MRTKKIAISSLLASLSLILAQISHYLKIIPGIPMITLDISDIPIFTSTLLFGSSSGYIILIVVSLLRAFLFSSAGIPGIIMRISVISIPIFFLGMFYKSKKNFLLICILASILSTLIKLPINYFFWTKFFSMPNEWIKSILFPIVAPVNLVKIFINLQLSYILSEKINNTWVNHE